MGLSCSCDYDDWDFEPGQWTYWFEDSSDFIPLDTLKRKRCCSCNELIDIGSLCIKYPRKRYPHTEAESRIRTGMWLEDSMNDEPCIQMADHYHCERCGEIFLNLTDLGFNCLSPNENMEQSLKEYHEMTGFKETA